ncbi:MAG: hypothetical protein MK213_00115 [Planctomycetes bacterium]|nr:hypothetical protein [Planctomycetota bacterium]
MHPHCLIPIALFLSASLSGQTTFLSEDFSSGVVPPSGWGEVNNGASLGWEPNNSMAWHDDYYGANDNHLYSSDMNLTGAASVFLHVDQNVVFSSWRDHHYIDITTNGGSTFTTVYEDFAGDGASSFIVDLSTYGGVSGVAVSFHYTGDYASEWSIDRVLVNDSNTPPPPTILHTAVNPSNGHTYHLLDSSTWTDAEASAVLLGGHLATVRSQTENDWIWQTFSYFGGVDRDLWIGLNDVAVEGTFVWSSGDPSTFRYWAANQPDNNGGNENYVHIGELSTDQWNDMFDAASTSWSPGYFGVVEITGPGGPTLSVSNLVAGQTATVDIVNCTTNGLVYLAYSLVGGGPINSAFGTAYVSPPFQLLPLVASPAGVATMSAAVPPQASGANIWIHAADVSLAVLTNPLAEVIG